MTRISISGAGGGGKGGGGSSTRVPQETADNLRSTQYARVLHLLGEGEIEGLATPQPLRSIYLDDTPIENTDSALNFNGAQIEWRTGTPNQPVIAGFAASESESQVGIEVKVSTPVTRSYSNANTDALRLTIGVPQLLRTNTSTGDVHGTSVQLAIDIQRNGSGWTQIISDTIHGKTTSRYQRSYRIDLTRRRSGVQGSNYSFDIRVRRLTPDSASSSIVDKFYWESTTEIVEQKLSYPHSALVGIQVDATQFRAIPRVAFDVKLMRVQVPVNYDPLTRSYAGFWNGTFKIAWTDNPAWCLYDLMTHPRYGLGQYITPDLVDKWALYDIAQYCDELVPNGYGGWEPRYTCNVYLQTREEAIKVLQHFASIFNGLVYWRGGMLTIAADKPANPVSLFTAANVIDGAFTYTGTPLNQRHTVCLVTWNDPADRCKQKIEYVEDAEGIALWGIREQSIVAWGCTSRGQAHRVGKWLLLSERYLSELIKFKTGINAALLRPGDLFKTADPHRAGLRYGGRLLVASTTQVTLDASVEITAGIGYRLTVILADGTLETRPIAALPGQHTVLNLVQAFSSAPPVMAIWGLASDSLAYEQWRCISVAEDHEGNVEITGIAHRPDKYAAIERNLALTPLSTTATTPFTQTAPTELNVLESLYHISPSVIGARATFSWLAPKGAVKYKVTAQREVDTPLFFDIPLSSVDIQPTQPGEWKFTVVAYNSLGIASPPAILKQTLQGLQAPPSDVAHISYVIEPFAVRLHWQEISDLDLSHYEIRQSGEDWETAQLVTTIKGTSHTLQALSAGNTLFRIKAVDMSGIPSVHDSYTSVCIERAAAPTVEATFKGPNIVLSWNQVAGSFATDRYEIRTGHDWSDATSVAHSYTNTFTEKVTYGGHRRYWVVAIDVAGNVGIPAMVDVVISNPSAVLINAEVIDNNVLLRWSDATTILPIDHYEIRKGVSWILGQHVGDNGNGRFATFFEQAAGIYTYWIVAFDTAGNQSSPTSINALVNQPPDYTLRDDFNSTFNGNGIGTWVMDGHLYAPLTSDTWQQHFDSHGWATPQAQINAGWPRYFQPSVNYAHYEEVIDYGTTLSSTAISVTLTSQMVSGAVMVTPTLDIKKQPTDAWTSYPGQSQIIANDFRFLRVRFEFSASSGDDLICISHLNIKLSTKLKNDSGEGMAIANDSGGTLVNFTMPFIDVSSITVTAKGTTARIAIYDFVDTPYPTHFKALLYDTDGNRVSGAFSWSAKGI